MRSDRGSSTLLMMVVMAAVAVVGVASTSVGLLLAERERASIASEAAALAAAVATYPPAASVDPVLAAREMVTANGAELVSCRCSIDPTLDARVVEVVALVVADVPIFGRMTVRRTARAEFDPRLWLGT